MVELGKMDVLAERDCSAVVMTVIIVAIYHYYYSLSAEFHIISDVFQLY